MKVGIDLLWVRPGKNGGTESYIRNILDGLAQFAKEDEKYFLYVSKNNRESFEKYFTNPNFIERLCLVDSNSLVKRIVWENLYLSKIGLKDKLDLWFMPVYSRPFFLSKKIPCITAIHDIQGLHYPEYFSKARMMYFKLMWSRACKKSNKILTISNFCKKDILKHYKINSEKIEVIYNPIITRQSNYDFSLIKEKYGVEKGNYLYTVSALAKHKNLITLLHAMKLLKIQGYKGKLLITGVSVNAQTEISKYIKDNQIEDVVLLTGYITDEERDCLYDNCDIFLFPSVFEGFGMPPIEAMRRGVPVITTKETSLLEVTQGKAKYVDNPFNAEEWVNKIATAQEKKEKNYYEFSEYNIENIIKQYRELFLDNSRSSKL